MHSKNLHSALLFILDTLMVLVVFNSVAWLRGIAGSDRWIIEPLVVPLGFIAIALYLIDGYRSRTEMMSANYMSQHVLAFLVALVATLLTTFVAIPANYPLQGSRSVIAFAFLTLAFGTLTYRRSMHRWALADQQDRCVLFVGEHQACEDFREICRRNELHERIVCAVLGDDTQPPFQFETESSLRMYHAVMAEIRSGELRVEAVVLRESGSQLPPDMANELTELYFSGVPTYTLEHFHETYWRKIPLYRINYVWLFQEGFEIARNPVFERAKRGGDIIMSTIGLILAAPVLLLAAVAIRLGDGGPVFFRQTRVGRNRRAFQILKLRTMRNATAAPVADPRYTQVDDPRITPVGRFLRKTRLDEVPQLWNVLKGEMSLIGPRAEWIKLVQDYETQISCYHFRHLVRPGITGWAQINYPYGSSVEDTLRKLEYDLYYIRHFSFVMDAAIILRTLNVMIFGKGR